MGEVNEELLEYVINQRLEKNQEVRERIVMDLTQNLEDTIANPERVKILLSTMKDSDSVDVRRLTIKQSEKDTDVAERVLSLLASISTQVSGNPYYVADATPTRELARPEHFYEEDDFSEGELSRSGTKYGYESFMDSRRAIPSAENLEPIDSTNAVSRSKSSGD